MRVLVDARGLLEEVKAGVESYTVQMLDNLKRIYPQDEYILFSYSWKKIPDEELAKKYNWIHKRWPNKLASISWRFLNWPKVDDIVGKCDWVWYPNIRFMPVNSMVKKIVTVHDLSFEVLPECYRTMSRWWHWYMNIKNNLNKSDIVMTVSKNTADDVIKIFGVDQKKVFYHHLGLLAKDLSELKKRRQKKQYFLHVGTLEKRKNIEMLLDAYLLWLREKQNKGCKRENLPDLVLVGGAGWSMNKDVHEKIISDKKIVYRGYVSEHEKNILLTNALGLIYISHYEGFGFPPLEAYVCGIPVITSFGGSLGEVVPENVLMIDSLSKGQLMQAMNIVFNSQSDVISNKDIKQVAQKFDWEKTAMYFRKCVNNYKG